MPYSYGYFKKAQNHGVFYTEGKNPYAFMDDVILRSDVPVKLEYVKGSAVLESNCIERKILLNDAVTFEDSMMITTIELNESLPEHCTYTYDFITFQVRVAEEQDHYIKNKFASWELMRMSGAIQ